MNTGWNVMMKAMSAEYETLKDALINRINDVFSSRPTWSHLPTLEHETVQSIQQIIDEEIRKFENETTRDEKTNSTSAE